MGITKYLDEALNDFEIYGKTNGTWEAFHKNVSYEAFLVKRKKNWTMSNKNRNTQKKPIVIIDESLDFFNDKVLFPKKLEKANEMLRKVGLPKEL